MLLISNLNDIASTSRTAIASRPKCRTSKVAGSIPKISRKRKPEKLERAASSFLGIDDNWMRWNRNFLQKCHL